jgi:GTP-binding protein
VTAPRRPLVALVGRPNVGKSTLFNRLVGRQLAIVEDLPGVTRDRNYADVDWDGRGVAVVDTGGFEPASRDRLVQQVKAQAQLAVDEAAAVVLVVDAREGVTSVDEAVAALLRRAGKPLFLAVNKVDERKLEGELPLAEFHRLGFGEVFAISAEHGRGIGDLLDAVADAVAAPALPPPPEELDEPLDEDEEVAASSGPIRVAVIGRPNVGKSTFVNALLGEERFVTSEVAGTTRDSIDASLTRGGRTFVLTDTAGIRRKRSIAQKVEAYSVVRAMRSIDDAEVVACLLDAMEAGAEQDARLLGLVAEKAKALVCVVNKWDLASAEGATQDFYREQLRKKLPFVAWAPLLFMSARTGAGVGKVLDTAARLVEQYRARFPTPVLNDLLADVQERHAAPIVRGHRVKLYYAAQVASAPPTFAIQCNRPESVSDGYKRFVENRFREAFGLEVPLRVVYKERRRRARPPPASAPAGGRGKGRRGA